MGVVTTSDFSTTAIFGGLHTSTDWQISLTSFFASFVSQSSSDTTNLTSVVFTGLFPAFTVYISARRVSGEHLSAWSTPVKVVTAKRSIVQPDITVENNKSLIFENPLLPSSDYSAVNHQEVHVSYDWVAYNFTVKYNSATLTSLLSQTSATTLTAFAFVCVYRNVWMTKVRMPVATYDHSQSTLLDGTVLVTGGVNATNTIISSVYLYS